MEDRSTLVFSGSEPGVGTFTVRRDDTDYCIFIVGADGERRERWCSWWRHAPHDLSRVYEILREHGFTMAGEARETPLIAAADLETPRTKPIYPDCPECGGWDTEPVDWVCIRCRDCGCEFEEDEDSGDLVVAKHGKRRELTRAQYLSGECTHDQYYAQFGIKLVRVVRTAFGDERIKASTDEHFNDIPLRNWDLLVPHAKVLIGGDMARINNTQYVWHADCVCALKSAAKIIRDTPQISELGALL